MKKILITGSKKDSILEKINTNQNPITKETPPEYIVFSRSQNKKRYLSKATKQHFRDIEILEGFKIEWLFTDHHGYITVRDSHGLYQILRPKSIIYLYENNFKI